MARPEGFEPPTTWFVARYSIQLSYGRPVENGVLEAPKIKRGGLSINLHGMKSIFSKNFVIG